MQVHLAYGKSGLTLELPDSWNITLVEPRYIPGLADPHKALLEGMREPIRSLALRELVQPGDKVGVVFSDITRPTPNHLLLPTVLEELSHIHQSNITLFNALGTHRLNTLEELCNMLGKDVVDGYRVIQNNAFDKSTQVCVGTSSKGHEIWLNRELMQCDIKILTGFIEPHFFAGFSGGGKAVMPGMAGQLTVLGNHDARMIADPKSTWGITWGNPIWEEIREVALQSGRLFLLNVTLNKDKQVTAVFAGDLDAAHSAGCKFVRQTAMVPVQDWFDIVVTTNSGYPLDLNLYQAVKGMSAAAKVVRQGGTIIIAAECWDGIPEHGLYAQLLREARNPQELLERISEPGFLEQDQWEAQIQAQIQLRADVYVYSDYLSDKQIETSLLKPCRNITETLEALLQRYGPRARICTLPEGPQTIPYIQARSVHRE